MRNLEKTIEKLKNLSVHDDDFEQDMADWPEFCELVIAAQKFIPVGEDFDVDEFRDFNLALAEFLEMFSQVEQKWSDNHD